MIVIVRTLDADGLLMEETHTPVTNRSETAKIIRDLKAAYPLAEYEIRDETEEARKWRHDLN